MTFLTLSIFGIKAWLFWLILAFIFFVFEAATVALLSVWFGLGALLAAAVAVLGAGVAVQIIVFILVSLMCLLWGIKYRDRIWIARKHKTPTNADRLLGKEGLVLEPINNLRGRGQVKVEGHVWSARTADGEPVEEGVLVRVTAISGVKLVVERI